MSTTTSTLISVIISSFHTGPSLERTIDSVLAQGEGIELILVNNGNPPDIESKLIERFKETPHVRVMTGHGDIGIVAGHNLGARVAQGDYLLFLDETCFLAQGVATFLRKEFEQENTPFILGAKVVDEKGKEMPLSRCRMLKPLPALVNALGLTEFWPRYKIDLAGQPFDKEIGEVPSIGGQFMFMAKSTFEKCHGFDEPYFPSLAAMSFCLRLTRLEGLVLFAPQALAKGEKKKQAAFDPQKEKATFKTLTSYYFNEFGHCYPAPLLWLVNGLEGIRLGISLLLKKRGTVL